MIVIMPPPLSNGDAGVFDACGGDGNGVMDVGWGDESADTKESWLGK